MAQQNQEQAIACIDADYGDIQQRWLIIHTQASRKRAIETVSKQLLKLTDKEMKLFPKLCRQTFSCEADATLAFEAFIKTQRVTEVVDFSEPYYKTKGCPKKDQKPDGFHYFITASLPSEYKQRVERKSYFILATNQKALLSDDELIKTYYNYCN